MNSHQEMVKEFMIAFGQEAPSSFSPEAFPEELRSSLIMEESLEFCQAAAEKDYVGVISCTLRMEQPLRLALTSARFLRRCIAQTCRSLIRKQECPCIGMMEKSSSQPLTLLQTSRD
jgi:hypothetical protein